MYLKEIELLKQKIDKNSVTGFIYLTTLNKINPDENQIAYIGKTKQSTGIKSRDT